MRKLRTLGMVFKKKNQPRGQGRLEVWSQALEENKMEKCAL